MADRHYDVAFFEPGDYFDLAAFDETQLNGGATGFAFFNNENVILVGFED